MSPYWTENLNFNLYTSHKCCRGARGFILFYRPFATLPTFYQAVSPRAWFVAFPGPPSASKEWSLLRRQDRYRKGLFHRGPFKRACAWTSVGRGLAKGEGGGVSSFSPHPPSSSAEPKPVSGGCLLLLTQQLLLTQLTSRGKGQDGRDSPGS